jgi:hypothetical protein
MVGVGGPPSHKSGFIDLHNLAFCPWLLLYFICDMYMAMPIASIP